MGARSPHATRVGREATACRTGIVRSPRWFEEAIHQMTTPQESDTPTQGEMETRTQATSPQDRTTEPTQAPTPGNGVQNQLAQAQEQANTLHEALQRERADFLNYRRRAAQEREDVSQRVRAQVFRTFLPVLDDLERALQQTPEGGAREPWLEGFRLVGRKLATILEQAGVTRVGAVGEPFNPIFHEAIGHRPPARPDEQVGSIAEVVRPGYRLGDQVLRPAQVIVVSSASTPPSDQHAGAASAG